MMDKKEAQALYQKYLDGSCTPEEIRLLETAFNHYLGSRQDMPSKQQLIDAEQQMMQAIDAHIPPVRKVKKSIWFRYAAAASVLIALAVGYAVWQGNRQQPMPDRITEHRAEPIIMPGGNQATLTLANGQTIDLSTDQEGIVIGNQVTYNDGSNINLTDSAANDNANPVYPFGKATPRYLVLNTSRGGEYQVTLQDGTKIWLNAESSLRYPLTFNEKNRVVQLTGEAYFEVKPDDRPFTVITDLGEVNVYGTAFNVQAYPEEQTVQTTLVTGKVTFTTMRMTLAMKPGELAVADVSGNVEKRSVDVNQYTGWRNGLYVFRESRLEDIMRELARWYAIEVSYQAEHIKNIAFTGNLKRYHSINTFLELLERTGEINYRIEGKKLILYNP